MRSKSDWKQNWDEGRIAWHLPTVHPFLEKYYDKFLNGKPANSAVFVPLCGKTQDMLWLYNKGHTVIGCEFVRQGCEDFFQENSINYFVETKDDYELFHNEDKRIQIFCCDVKIITRDLIGRSIDCIWDRGGLEAIDTSFREQYLKIMFGLLLDNFSYLLVVHCYDQSLYEGPPMSFQIEDISKLFGSYGNFVHLLDEDDDDSNRIRFNLPSLLLSLYHITPKI